jgi:hypothetical protein
VVIDGGDTGLKEPVIDLVLQLVSTGSAFANNQNPSAP